MKRDCAIVLNGCPGVDSPITNASSEAPDPLLFAGWGWSPNPPFPPPLNGPPTNPVDCSDITWSEVSPELAQLFAQINAQFCTPPTPPTTPGPVPPPPPVSGGGTATDFSGPSTLRFQAHPDNFQIFYNDKQTASVTCPNGAVFTFTVEAGTTASPPLDPRVGPAWVAYINAYILAFLLQQIYNMQVCIDVPNMDQRTPPGTTPIPGGRGATLSANPGWICQGDFPSASQNTYRVSGGGTYTFSVSGNLPPGMTLVQTGPRTAEIQGSPTTPGVYNYTVEAVRTDAPGFHVQVADTYNVIGITANPPDATQNLPYSFQLTTAGAVAPVTFEAQGALPAGLSLATDGTISGTPTVAGTSSVQVKMTDAQGAVCFATVNIEVEAPAVTGPDWDDLFWGVANIYISGSGNATFSPENSASSGFSASASGTKSDGDDSFGSNTASLSYNGPAVTCYLHVNYQFTAVACNDFRPFVIVNGATIYAPTVLQTGPAVVPFNIADTGGIPTLITVQASARYSQFTACNIAQETMTLVGYFSNSP